MQFVYPLIDHAAGWGLLLVCVLALGLRAVQARQSASAPGGVPSLLLAAAPGAAGSTLLALAGLGGFALLASQVMAETTPAWLVALDGWVAGHRTAWPEFALQALVALTHLGDFNTLTGVTVLVALALAWRGRWRAMGWWLLATAGNGLLVRWCKQVFGRSRPDTPYLEVHGYSFPSGHAMSSLVVYGLLAVILWGWGRRPARTAGLDLPGSPARRLAVAIAVLAVAIGASRVWLEVHYASDVLAGWLLALGWLGALSLLVRPLRMGRDG